MYLSTSPYLSFAGAHLPRLKMPVPLHLMVGRRVAFATFRVLARHAAWTLQGAGEREFVHQGGTARRGQGGRPAREGPRHQASPSDCGRRAAHVREELHVTATVRRLPAPIARWIRDSPLTQDALISNMEYVLAGA